MRQRTRGNKKNEAGASQDRWLVTYADLITLVLIFFVMMYAMSRLDTEKYEVVTQSLQHSFKSGDSILEMGSGLTGTEDQYRHKNPDSSKDTGQQGPGSDQDNENSSGEDNPLSARELAFREQEQELQSLMDKITQYVEDNKLEDQIFVTDKPQGLTITLSDRFLFDPGRADLKTGSGPVLDKLASLFKELNTIVSIEGHTDNIPIGSGSRYRDNWDLSGARALSVLRFFLEQKNLDPDGFQYAGYADTRPAGNNSTESGRQKNRRVEIIVLRQLQEE